MEKIGEYINCGCREGTSPPPHPKSPASQRYWSHLDKYFENRAVVSGEKKKR